MANVPHKCPVCNGARTVSRPPWIAGDVAFWVVEGTSIGPWLCGACRGSGIVWSDETTVMEEPDSAERKTS